MIPMAQYARLETGAMVVATVVVALIGMWMNDRNGDDLAAIRQEVAQLRQDARRVGNSVRDTEPGKQLESIREQLPDRVELPSRLDVLHRIASGYGVRINQAAYQTDPSTSSRGRIGRYVIRLDAEGEYYRLRYFLRDLLAEDRFLALDSFELRRPPGRGYNSAGKPLLATLHMVMYFGPDD